jgi:heat-inducible transcriptional repressor
MELNLTQRQQNILLAIVLDYIETAEPVGSRTISKKIDMSLSPATIRNDMAELEEHGLLTQPHSSAGRIPSDLGYRNFVDFLMKKPLLSNNDKEAIKNIQYNTSKLDVILEQSARIISALSNTVAIIQYPESNREFVKHFQLLPINDTTFVIIIVSSTGKVNDYRVHLEEPVDESFFITITNYFNEELVGTPVNQLQRKLMEMVSGNVRHDNILKSIYNSLKENLKFEKSKFSVTGTSNLLKEPEFGETLKAHSLINFFEKDEKDQELSDLFIEAGNSLSKEGEPVIIIGKEIKISQLQNCSLIIGSYKIGDSATGALGLLGPTRMQYGKSVAALEEMLRNLSYLLAKLYGIKINNTE